MSRGVVRTRKRPAERASGARRAPFPAFIEPCDPTPRSTPPPGADWVYEIKADGYRAQLHLQQGIVTVYSRSGLDWTLEFAAIANLAAHLAKRDCIIDGEAVVYGNTGLPDFQALRRELGKKASPRLRYHAFDIMYLDGKDLRPLPYVERKRILAEVLKGAPDQFVYVDYLEDEGSRVIEHACDMGLEGIIAKKRNAPYRSGRTEEWIKLKCSKSVSLPIVAFVEKLGARPRKIASLYVGRHEGNRLLYAGKVRTGFSEMAARSLRERLDPLITRKSSLAVAVKKPKATWVKPDVIAEIVYGGVTDDGLLREAVFKGLRDDLAVPVVESPSIRPTLGRNEPSVGVPRENILQLLPDAVVPTKAELIAYWKRVGTRALNYLGHRPLKLVRHTHGTTFYHKGKLPPIPPSVHQLKIRKREGGEGVRLWVDDVDGLLGLVEMGAVELHPWAARVDDIEHPDVLVFDLDPGPGVEWEFVVQTALKLKAWLETEGHESWPKLTGGKGMHLMVPIQPRITHDQARKYCRAVAQELEATAPDKYTTSPLPARRANRIYIDYLRNGRGTTAIGAYSPRAQEGFPVAAPVTWKQVGAGISPGAFTMSRPPRRG